MNNTSMNAIESGEAPEDETASSADQQPTGVPRARRRPAKKKKPKPLRLFLGLGFPLHEKLAPLHDDLHKLAGDAPSLRVAPAKNLHITLKFLGPLKAEQIPEIHTLCAPICARYGALEISSHGIGVFKNSLWVGVAPNEQLAALASELHAAARLLAVADENKDFQPHVTVARFGKDARGALSPLLNKYQASAWGSFTAHKCYLYQSETLQEGARYSIIQGYPLSAGADSCAADNEADPH